MKNRVYVIQEVINQKRANVYLEIGIRLGNTFHKIKIKRKIGIDPNCKIKKWKRFISIFKNIWNVFNQYYWITSDDFFKNKSDVLIKCGGLDVVFIDGLHTYEQSLRDVQNCLKFLKEDGIIILHDCNPPFESAAYPAKSCEDAQSLNLPGWTGQWNGDVWKTIAYLRSTQNNLNIFVLDCDYGLGIITKGKPENTLEYTIEEVNNFSYKDLEKNRKKILNLKSPDYFKEFIKRG